MNIEILFWASVLLLVYTYVGYPLLVTMLASLSKKTIQRRPQLPSVTLILAVHNGAEWIEAKLSNCLTLDYPHDLLNIVLVSDGSTDNTVSLARAFESPRVEIIDAPRQGKAACLNRAVSYASGDILVFTDVRQRLENDVIRQLVSNFGDASIGAASGELMLEADPSNGFSGGMDIYWRYEKFVREQESRFSSSVGVTGAIYAMRRELYQNIPPQTVLDDVLIPMNVVCAGYRVVFDPHAHAYDIPSASTAREQRRKVRTIAGNYQLVLLKPSLLNPFRNPIWLQFVSHKLLRLAIPLFLVVALPANLHLALDSTFYKGTLLVQLALYLLAVSGILLPSAQRLRLIRVPSTFLLLNWFAVLGFFSFARHGRYQPW